MFPGPSGPERPVFRARITSRSSLGWATMPDVTQEERRRWQTMPVAGDIDAGCTCVVSAADFGPAVMLDAPALHGSNGRSQTECAPGFRRKILGLTVLCCGQFGRKPAKGEHTHDDACGTHYTTGHL